MSPTTQKMNIDASTLPVVAQVDNVDELERYRELIRGWKRDYVALGDKPTSAHLLMHLDNTENKQAIVLEKAGRIIYLCNETSATMNYLFEDIQDEIDTGGTLSPLPRHIQRRLMNIRDSSAMAESYIADCRIRLQEVHTTIGQLLQRAANEDLPLNLDASLSAAVFHLFCHFPVWVRDLWYDFLPQQEARHHDKDYELVRQVEVEMECMATSYTQRKQSLIVIDSLEEWWIKVVEIVAQLEDSATPCAFTMQDLEMLRNRWKEMENQLEDCSVGLDALVMRDTSKNIRAKRQTLTSNRLQLGLDGTPMLQSTQYVDDELA